MKSKIEWNAGDLGCGELVIKLRSYLRDLAGGEIIKVTALDSGAREDIPAWCRLTGHTLAKADHPQYWIMKKES